MFYDKQGNNVASETYPISFYSLQGWRDVAPNTVADIQLTMACQLAGLN